MKPELPPMNHEALEAKVTALLLGELPEGEAKLMRELVARDASLAKFQAQMELTLGILRETVATPEPVPAALMKLSEDRREKLLAQFKTVAPPQLLWPQQKRNSLLGPLAAVAAFLLLVNVTVRLVPDPSTWGPDHPQASYHGTDDKELQQESVNSALRKHNEEHSRVDWKGLTERDAAGATPNQSRGAGNEVREPEGRMGGRATRSRGISRPMFDPSHPEVAPRAKDENLVRIEPESAEESTQQTARRMRRPRNSAANTLAENKAQSPGGQSQSTQSTSGQETVETIDGRAIMPSGPVPGSALPIASTVATASANNVKNPAHLYDPYNSRSSHSVDVNGSQGVVQETLVGGGFFLPPAPTPTPEVRLGFGGMTGGTAVVEVSSDKKAKFDVLAEIRTATSRSEFKQGYGNQNSTAQNAREPAQLASAAKQPPVAVTAAAAAPASNANNDAALIRAVLPPPIPQPEEETQSNKFSTFSLNISDASYKLAAASLQNGVMPQPASIRSEEFINAFDYRDPDPPAGAPIGFAWDRAQDPFAHNRDWLRFSVKAAAQGREAGRPLNLVLLLDKSGSMERADRVAIIHEALRALASQLNERDTLSVVVFARTARLWMDGVPGSRAGEAANGLDGITPEGGTNLEEAMKLAYETALRHYAANGENRVVLLTDGAANLGSVDPETLKRSVKAHREQGIALDCFGVGFDGYNDNLMEALSRTGNGRYGFINTPEEAGTEFAGKLAGALRVAASDVKVQVEFNPSRVTAWRQIGYAKHQLRKEDFRDNSVTAAQIGAAESGNALYVVEVNPTGEGSLCTVRVRFREPGTSNYQEHAWDVPYTGTAIALGNATPATRLAVSAAAFSEWLALSPYAGDITPDQLLGFLRGVPEAFGADARPKNLAWMIIQAKSISGK